MEFVANEGKSVAIDVDGTTYLRHAIKTHFIEQGESYLELVSRYVLPVYQPGDIVSCSEKVISLCQNRVVRRDQIKIGFWAKALSRFASHPTTGVGVGETIKMQYAIDTVGLPRVLWASLASGVTKVFGKRGVFYEIVGPDVAGLDGFYDHVWQQYGDIGIRLPDDPAGVCDEIHDRLGVSFMIIDANDLGQEVLGCSRDVTLTPQQLKALIRDNPTGQGRNQTPLVLIRKQ